MLMGSLPLLFAAATKLHKLNRIPSKQTVARTNQIACPRRARRDGITEGPLQLAGSEPGPSMISANYPKDTIRVILGLEHC